MTCIVGIADGTNVYIGGERGHSDSDVIVSSLAPKVFNKSHYLIGFAGNTGMGQSIAYTFDAPTHRINTDTYRYVYEFFIPALKDHLKDQIPEKEDSQTSFLLGIRGKLFEIDTSDFQCVEYAEVAIGSGAAYAMGSLHTTYTYNISTIDRIQHALDAAITYSPTCQGPIDILHI
jgi:ATP-dependent protease HslVU (ClpYQ) peptidase subunit